MGVLGGGEGRLCMWGGGEMRDRGCYVIGDKQKNSSQQKISSHKFDVKYDVTITMYQYTMLLSLSKITECKTIGNC